MNDEERERLRTRLPARKELLWPSLEVLRDFGDTFKVAEHDVLVREHLNLSEAVAEVESANGKDTEFRVRMRVVRYQLKQAGLLEDVGYGEWRLRDRTNLPRTEDELKHLVYIAGQQARRAKKGRREDQSLERSTEPVGEAETAGRMEISVDPIIAMRQQDLRNEYRKLIELHGRRSSHRERYEELAEELRRHNVDVEPLPDWL